MSESDKNFNNIKIHTQYSICEGAIKIDELAEYCKLNKIRSIGLADSYNLCGALEFSEKLSSKNKFTSLTIKVRMNSPAAVVSVYKKASALEGIMAL